ncbi:hypothetical protein GI364_03205 [Alicyclobacillus sp. SO9]|nr:hypothetical protein GI364_03205 [Alicyclobacillus sp. SO9]
MGRNTSVDTGEFCRKIARELRNQVAHAVGWLLRTCVVTKLQIKLLCIDLYDSQLSISLKQSDNYAAIKLT